MAHSAITQMEIIKPTFYLKLTNVMTIKTHSNIKLDVIGINVVAFNNLNGHRLMFDHLNVHAYVYQIRV